MPVPTVKRRLSLDNRLILSSSTVSVLLAASLVVGPTLGPFITLNSSVVDNVSGIQDAVSVPVNSVADKTSSVYVAKYLESYFSDIPIMAEVAKCESKNRQFDKSGKALRGEQNKADRGALQINEYYHRDTSEKLGLDIYTLEGNAKYARHLFEREGVRPWRSSSKCWTKTSAYIKYKEVAKK